MALRSLRPPEPAEGALLDPDQHACRVDIVDLEVRDLGDAKAGTIGDTERSLVLDARRRREQLCGFLDAQHFGQLARMPDNDQRPRQIPSLQRHREQEAQRRDRAVDRTRADPVLMLG
jgi:hypothetical protein